MVGGTIEMSRCGSCHAEFLPRPGVCPRCGANQTETIALPARGTVRAATELWAPATGWTAPHRLALVEIADGIRLLCVAGESLPAIGAEVTIARDGAIYRIQ
jgi:uncharacterized OB-fold protein